MHGKRNWLFIVLMGSTAAPGNTAAQDAYARADRLFRMGSPVAATVALGEALSDPAPMNLAPDPGVLARVVRENGRHAIRLARKGDGVTAQRTVSMGAAVARQYLHRKNVTCQDVCLGTAMWRRAAMDQEHVWGALGRTREMQQVRQSRERMNTLAQRVILPRASRFAGKPHQGNRQDVAEARSLVRLWENTLVRAAIPNLAPTP